MYNPSTGRQRWKDGKFQASLGYIETTPSQKNNNKLNQSIEVYEFCTSGSCTMVANITTACRGYTLPQISLPLRPSIMRAHPHDLI